MKEGEGGRQEGTVLELKRCKNYKHNDQISSVGFVWLLPLQVSWIKLFWENQGNQTVDWLLDDRSTINFVGMRLFMFLEHRLHQLEVHSGVFTEEMTWSLTFVLKYCSPLLPEWMGGGDRWDSGSPKFASCWNWGMGKWGFMIYSFTLVNVGKVTSLKEMIGEKDQMKHLFFSAVTFSTDTLLHYLLQFNRVFIEHLPRAKLSRMQLLSPRCLPPGRGGDLHLWRVWWYTSPSTNPNVRAELTIHETVKSYH